MNRTVRMILAVVCIVVIAVCGTMIARKLVGATRVDLTEDRVYSISEGTRNLLAKMTQPITLKLFYTRAAARRGPEGIRYWIQYFLYVRDLLEEYVGLSNGKLSLTVIDPERYTDVEEEAFVHGLKRTLVSADEFFIFGLVAETELGKTNTIEFFEPGRQEFVEYDISKMLADTMRRKKKKVGVLSSLPVMGAANMSPYMMQMMRMQGRMPPAPWTIVQHLRGSYEVEQVAADVRELPSDIDFLMVVHPKNLSERTLFAIDQFVMKGGKLLVFVDPHCLKDRPPPNPRNPYAGMQHNASSELNMLLEGWGVGMDPGVIAADRRLGLKVRGGDGRIDSLPTFIGLNEDCVNKDEVVTAKLTWMLLRFPGVLKKVPGTEPTVVPLLTTTGEGGTWKPSAPHELHMAGPDTVRRNMVTAAEPLMLACRISGKLKTNFPDGMVIEAEGDDDKDKDEDKAEGAGDKKEDAKDEKEKEPQKKERTLKPVKEAAAGAMIIVVADVDMLSDALAYREGLFGMQPYGHNSALVMNAMEFLGGAEELITIRSRGRFHRPFKAVDDIEMEVRKATAEKEKEIDERISQAKKRLEEIRSKATKENKGLVGRKWAEERRAAELQVQRHEKEKRNLKRGGRERTENLKFWLQFHNMVWAPAAVLLIAIALAIVRAARARYYASRRS